MVSLQMNVGRLVRSRALSLCNSCAYGTRAAFHSMLFIFAPVKSFASSFLHFIFKLFYVVGGFSVFRCGANNINVCVCLGWGYFVAISFVHHIASHRMAHVWCVSLCLSVCFCFQQSHPRSHLFIVNIHSFIWQRARNALAFYIFKIR